MANFIFFGIIIFSVVAIFLLCRLIANAMMWHGEQKQYAILPFNDFLEFYERDTPHFDLYRYSIFWTTNFKNYTFKGVDIIKYRIFYRRQERLKKKQFNIDERNRKNRSLAEIRAYYKREL
jgi:hypothetical protein